MSLQSRFFLEFHFSVMGGTARCKSFVRSEYQNYRPRSMRSPMQLEHSPRLQDLCAELVPVSMSGRSRRLLQSQTGRIPSRPARQVHRFQERGLQEAGQRRRKTAREPFDEGVDSQNQSEPNTLSRELSPSSCCRTAPAWPCRRL